MVQVKTKCDDCVNKGICKFVKDASLVHSALIDVGKLLESNHFNLQMICPTYISRNNTLVRRDVDD